MPLADVRVGDVLLVAPGDVVPVDGAVTRGVAVLDESALSGEAIPVERAPGDAIRSGVLNAGGPFDVRATSSAEDSTYAGIIRLVAEAEKSQAPFVRLADRYALWFLPLTLAVAGVGWVLGGPARAVAVLVVATPCPLILAAPVALVSGLSAAARRGVVVKNGAVLERLAQCTALLLDKTGTLTVGQPALTAIVPAAVPAARDSRPRSVPPDDILRLAASLDQASGHVLATAIVAAATARGCQLTVPEHVTETPGQGIAGQVAGHRVALGRAEWTGITGKPPWLKTVRRRARLDGALTVFVAIDGEPAGALLLEDRLRPDARGTIRALRRGGITRIVLATGDRAEVADAVGALTGVDEVLAGLTPGGKLSVVMDEQRDAAVIMVGDGINDAPALALADVGVAMGARGSTASSEAADAVLTVDSLSRLGDVAAILNALRALRAPRIRVARRVRPADAALTQRFRDEHEAIRACIDQAGAAADALSGPSPAKAMPLVRKAHQLLTSEVWPHEYAEESQLYPMVSRVVGGTDPTAPMSRAHAEIAHQITRLGRLLEDITDDNADEADLADLRGLLYGLEAILRLHTKQEDETYLALDDSPLPGTTAAATKFTSS